MKYSKLLAMGCAVVLATAGMTGCGKTTTDTTQTSEAEESESVTAQVTAIDGNTVTADLGEMAEMQAPGDGEAPKDGQGPSGEKSDSENTDSQNSDSENSENQKQQGEAPEKPDGEAPSGEKPDGEAPSGEKPDGEAPSGEKPDGEAPSDNGGENSGAPNGAPDGQGQAPSMFTASGESVTFTLTEDTQITVEQGSETTDGTADDIKEGSILELTLDSDNNALTVVVKNAGGPGGAPGQSSDTSNGTAATTIDSDSSADGETYSSTGDDENALRVDGATAELTNITINKTEGSSSNADSGDFYGMNAGLLAQNGATVTIKNATVNTSVKNGNGVFSYGTGTTVNISDSTIRTTGDCSGGIQTTGGGITNASNLDVETEGNSSAAIRSDRGGGTVNVKGGTYVTNGTGSPAVYSTADISVSDAALTANNSEAVVVEGKNSVSLTDCVITGNMTGTYQDDSENIHNIMIYQSMSGDAEVGEASFTAEGGSITAKSGDMFYITNTDCTISLKNVAFKLANEVFLRVEGNSSSRGWGTEGSNGGDVVLNAENQEIEGQILVDEISSLKLSLTDGSTFTGSINPDGAEGTVDVTLSEDSTWTLTGDSYVTSFTGSTDNITANGYHLYVNGEQVL